MRGAGKLPSYPISFERIVATENIAAAWQKVKSNKGAPGLDGVTIVVVDLLNRFYDFTMTVNYLPS